MSRRALPGKGTEDVRLLPWGAKHSTCPQGRRHLGSLSCVACHGRPEGTDLRVRVFIRGKKTPDAEAVDRDGNHLIDRDEWRDSLGSSRTPSGGTTPSRRDTWSKEVSTPSRPRLLRATPATGEKAIFRRPAEVTGSTSYEIPVDLEIHPRASQVQGLPKDRAWDERRDMRRLPRIGKKGGRRLDHRFFGLREMP